MEQLTSTIQARIAALIAPFSSEYANEIDQISRDSFLMDLCKLQALAGFDDRTFSTIGKLSEQAKKFEALEWLATMLASKGQTGRAIAVAESIIELSYQSEAFSGISKAIQRIASLEMALQVASMARNPKTRSETYLYLCTTEAEVGNFSAAISIAEKIHFASFRARALLVIATAAGRRGNFEEALGFLQQAMDRAERVEDHLERAAIFRELGELSASMERTELALIALRSSSEAASMVNDAEDGAAALLLAGMAQISILDYEGATKTQKDIDFALQYVDPENGDLQEKYIELMAHLGSGPIDLVDAA